MRVWFLFSTVLAAFAAAGLAHAAERAVTGVALIRERIALPPNARFEAVLEDTSRAGAPSVVLARAVKEPAGQSPIRFEIRFDDSTLDPRGRYTIRGTITIDGRLAWTTDTITPAPVRAGGAVELRLRPVGGNAAAPAPSLRTGAFVYFADAASFEDCRTGRRYPVAMEGGYKELEALYRDRRSAPAVPLVVSIEGRVEPRAGMEGPPRRTIVVTRALAAWPGETCERNRANTPFAETYWRIAVLNGEKIEVGERQREPSLVFRAGKQPGLAATAGCNRLLAGYDRNGRSLTISPSASTQMACPPALAERERALTQALSAVRSFAISGSAMVLYDAARAPLMVLQAVALR
ncbi:MAG: YbaY family lipoprotein [Beijerinckiaceae bacterium]